MKFLAPLVLLGLAVALTRGWWEWRNHSPRPASLPTLSPDEQWQESAWRKSTLSAARLRALPDLLTHQWPQTPVFGLSSLPDEESHRDLRFLLQAWGKPNDPQLQVESIRFSTQHGEILCQVRAQGPTPTVLAFCADLLAAKPNGRPIPDPRHLRLRAQDGGLHLTLAVTPFARTGS